MPLTATAIRRALHAQANPGSVAILQSFFKTGPGQYGDGDRFIGVKVPGIRTLTPVARNFSCASVTVTRI